MKTLSPIIVALALLASGVQSTHLTPRAEARGMLRVNTERRFLPRFKNRGLAPSNVSFQNKTIAQTCPREKNWASRR